MKLTQNQRAVLTSACENEPGFATRPHTLKAWQVSKMASTLIERGLIKEVRAKGNAPVWREDEQGRGYALKILKAGREAIAAQTPKVAAAEATMVSPSVNTAEAIDPSPRVGSKQSMVVAMLREKSGATLEGLITATGWLPHTTRAALTGLRKKGFKVERERQDGSPSIYRIKGKPTSAAA